LSNADYIYEDNVECYFYGSFYCDYFYGDDCTHYYTLDVANSTVTFEFGLGPIEIAFGDVPSAFNEAAMCVTGLYGDYWARPTFTDDSLYDYCGEAGYSADTDTCIQMNPATCEYNDSFGYYECSYDEYTYYYLPF